MIGCRGLARVIYTLSQAIERNGVIARRVPVVELVDAADGDVEKQSLKHARDGAWEET